MLTKFKAFPLILGFATGLHCAVSFSSPNTTVTQSIHVPTRLATLLKSFEPSAAVYMPDLDRYLVASDDTTEANDPWLFVMDSEGQVESSPIVIRGLKAITDIESISSGEDGALYILGSQGVNKKGKVLQERNLFVQALRRGRTITALQILELRPLLIETIARSLDSEIQSLRNRIAQDLDIESHLIHRGRLLVGLKNPKSPRGDSYVMDLGPIKELFESKKISSIQIAVKLNFTKAGMIDQVLSEIRPLGATWLLTTTSESGNGALWTYDLNRQQLLPIRTYRQRRPEGLAFNSKTQDIMVFFDQGKDPAQFQKIPVTFRESSY